MEKAILIHCLPEDDLKKHIWTLIMWTLLQNLVDILLWLWLCSMISGELYLSLLAGDLALFLQVTFFLWMQIVCIHIGDFLAAVKVEPFLVNMTPVEV